MSKTIIEFGVWKVTEYGIEHSKYTYPIAKERLWETTDRYDEELWDWLIHMVEKTWLSDDDLKDLVIAFAFAQDYFIDHKPPHEGDNVSMAQTLYIQQQMIENRRNASKIKSPRHLSIPPDEETLEYNRQVREVTKQIKTLPK